MSQNRGQDMLRTLRGPSYLKAFGRRLRTGEEGFSAYLHARRRRSHSFVRHIGAPRASAFSGTALASSISPLISEPQAWETKLEHNIACFISYDMLDHSISNSIILYQIILYFIVLYCILLHHYIILYCITLNNII